MIHRDGARLFNEIFQQYINFSKTKKHWVVAKNQFMLGKLV